MEEGLANPHWPVTTRMTLSVLRSVSQLVRRSVGPSVHRSCFTFSTSWGRLVILTCITATAHPTRLMLSCIRPCSHTCEPRLCTSLSVCLRFYLLTLFLPLFRISREMSAIFGQGFEPRNPTRIWKAFRQRLSSHQRPSRTFFVNEWTNERTSEWTNKRTNECTNERTNERPTKERTNEWTNEQTENLPILQDFVPYWGRCLASPQWKLRRK